MDDWFVSIMPLIFSETLKGNIAPTLLKESPDGKSGVCLDSFLEAIAKTFHNVDEASYTNLAKSFRERYGDVVEVNGVYRSDSFDKHIKYLEGMKVIGRDSSGKFVTEIPFFGPVFFYGFRIPKACMEWLESSG